MNQDQFKKLESDLWRAADSLRANSDLKASEYSTPVLGLIFLKFADNKYRQHEAAILAEYQKLKGSRIEKKLSDIAIERCGFYLPDHARYSHLLALPEKEDIANALKKAMLAIEEYKPELEGVLPHDEYFRLTRSAQNSGLAQRLLKIFADIPADAGGDLFGKIYEYFLSNFALSEGQGGGEFFTPRSVVKLMVEIIEPHGGKVFDPACGSGGMFVQSAEFIAAHRADAAAQNKAEDSIYVYGQEKTLETVKLAKMNLAVNGLRGTVIQANTYTEDPHGSLGQFDYVMANPPFNVDDVSVAAVEGDPRFNTYGIPRNKTKLKKADEGKETVPNANYLWINLFATSLKPKGRAALVMANSASDARHSEADIRQALIEANLTSATLDAHNTAQHQLHAAFAPFFTALHASLKALDKILRQLEKQQTDAAQAQGKRGSTDRTTKALKAALEALHTEVKESESWFAHIAWLQARFPKAQYEDVTGLCKLATRAEVAEQDWSLNPGRYVGVVIEEDGKTEEEFITGLLEMNAELTRLNAEARVLEEVIAGNVALLAGEE